MTRFIVRESISHDRHGAPFNPLLVEWDSWRPKDEVPHISPSLGDVGSSLYVPNLTAARAFAFAASSSRFFGGAFVSSDISNCFEIAATSSIAFSNAASFAFDGLVNPLIFRTNCNEAARISSSVTGGSKLNRFLMFLHIGNTYGRGSSTLTIHGILYLSMHMPKPAAQKVFWYGIFTSPPFDSSLKMRSPSFTSFTLIETVRPAGLL